MKQNHKDDHTSLLIYHKYDTLLAPVFVQFLEKNNINMQGLVVLNILSSTGALAAKLAEKSARVRACDTDTTMVNFARNTYSHLNNLSFKNHYPTRRLSHVAVIDTQIDYVQNKEEIFQYINDCLPTDNGELFITISTKENKDHPKITTAKKMIPYIATVMPYLTLEEITDNILPKYPSTQKLHSILESSGFDIIKSEIQSNYLPITKQQIRDLYIPVITSIPIFEYIPNENKEEFIQEYIKLYIPKLQKTHDNKFLEPIITTVIHACKVKNIS